MNPSKNIYVFQNKHSLKMSIKSRKYGPTLKYVADSLTQVRVIDTATGENAIELRKRFVDHFGSLDDITPSKANCAAIDAISLDVIGFPNTPLTFNLIKKFEMVWPELVKHAAKREIPEEDQHLKIYPLYLHKVTKSGVLGNHTRLWLSESILNHATTKADILVNPKSLYSEVIVVYIFHKQVDRIATLQAVASHEGDWENPRSIGVDEFSLTALRTIMSVATQGRENFNLLDLV